MDPSDRAAMTEIEAALEGAGVGFAPELGEVDDSEYVALWLRPGAEGNGAGGPSPPAEGRSAGTLIGRTLTHIARQGELPEILGRENEIDALIEALCRRYQRNAVLVGNPGCGRAAIVQGLAQRIVDGRVPDELRDSEVIELSASALFVHAGSPGEIADEMIAFASDPLAVLFIDDFRYAIGEATYDFGVGARMRPVFAERSDSLRRKPHRRASITGLSRATRRSTGPFNTSACPELSPELTLDVLRAESRVAGAEGSAVTDEVLAAVVSESALLRNRSLPEKALDLLDRTVTRAERLESAPSAGMVRELVRR